MLKLVSILVVRVQRISPAQSVAHRYSIELHRFGLSKMNETCPSLSTGTRVGEIIMKAFKSINRILILATDITICLMAGIIASNAIAAQVTLAWNPNTESDLAGYRIHCGTASGNYSVHTDVHNVTTYIITGLTEGQTYYFAATAYDKSGNESGYSNQAIYTVPTATESQSLDTDGDGVPDSQDAFPNDPEEWADANGNGIGDNADAAVGRNKKTPDAPVLISPVNDAAVSAMAELKTGTFRTAITGTTHAQTRWQVFRDDDDICMLDIQSTTALISLGVPKLVLEEGTPYFWRAQFVDSNGTPSEWSDYGYFSTQTTDKDINANGIPDIQEVSRGVDLNCDGIKDYRQPSIKSVKMEGTGVQIGVSIRDAPTALAIEAVESENPNQLDASATGKPTSLPFGLIDFKIAVAEPGDRAAVTLYFSEAAPTGSRWYMFDTVSRRWADFSGYANFAADRKSVVLTLTDGGPGDADGVANGAIVDPGGIGVSNYEVIKRSRKHR